MLSTIYRVPDTEYNECRGQLLGVSNTSAKYKILLNYYCEKYKQHCVRLLIKNATNHKL